MTRDYGTWPSPLSPARLAEGQVRSDEVRVDGADTYWLESRPSDGGRTALVRHRAGTVSDVTPAGANVRSRVHEYGGGAYAVSAGTLVWSEFADGRLRRLDPGASEPVALTPEVAVRYGGLVLAGPFVYAVREDHRGDGEPVNTLVRLDLAGPNDDAGTVLVQGSDFVSRPAVSTDGHQLAWVTWDHPDMPWDASSLWRAEVGPAGLSEPVLVAGGPGVSVVQPQFDDQGRLWFVSDEHGWWQLHRADDAGVVRVHAHEADLAQPPWVLGMIDFAVLPGDRVLTRHVEGEFGRLSVLDATTGQWERLADDGVVFEHLQAVVGDDGEVDIAYRRGLADRLPEIVRGPLSGPRHVLARSGADLLDPHLISRAVPRQWTNGSGLTAYGLFYAPVTSPGAEPSTDRPPLLVFVHGGPTSRAEAAFSLAVQFWTTRGFAVLDVNHGGSTGYGRAYRERLRGQWGVVDIDDCVSGARALAADGLIDGARLAIRGGSAGGYTTLRAMTSSTAFTAGTSLYGIADLRALLADDHKFESRYTIGLVAPWPDGEQVYLDRSPVTRVADLHGHLLLLQGADDLVVPVGQATLMAQAMTAAGKDVELVIYEGEGHGFRRADTIIDAAERELAHYRHAFGLGDGQPGGDERPAPEGVK